MTLAVISRSKFTTLIGLLLGFALVGAMPQELTTHQQTTFDARPSKPELTALIPDFNSDGNSPNRFNSQSNDKLSETSVKDGNPLWSISLATLTATRERPLFSPSRRPLPGVSPVPIQATAPSNQPPRPNLSLVGAIVGETEGIAIFVDESTKGIVRLKTGEGHLGWTLRTVKGREATLQRDRAIAILAIANAPNK